MSGDFSRDTAPAAHLARYSRVLLQQGRPLLDAEFNEQSAILLDFLRTLIVDLMGTGWRPTKGQFEIGPPDTKKPNEGFTITAGHFYVDGVLCDNPQPGCTYAGQPHPPMSVLLTNVPYIAVIECWERHVCAVQQPALRELALGGPDTASRAQIVWQVRAATQIWVESRRDLVLAALPTRLGAADDEATILNALQAKLPGLTTDLVNVIKNPNPDPDDVTKAFKIWSDAGKQLPPRLRARAKSNASSNEACTISSDAGFRGVENQLYRVEVHAGGIIPRKVDGTTPTSKLPTFKWSRENGSVLFAVRAGQPIGTGPVENGKFTASVPIETLGYDRRTGLCVGDWVELTSDTFELEGLSPPLGRVTSIDRTRRIVSLEMIDDKDDPHFSVAAATALRRWDQTAHVNDRGTMWITETADTNGDWLTLENGVQIQFQPGGVYRTGDYWLIPARVASGVLWQTKGSVGEAVFVDAQGVARHQAAIGHGV